MHYIYTTCIYRHRQCMYEINAQFILVGVGLQKKMSGRGVEPKNRATAAKIKAKLPRFDPKKYVLYAYMMFLRSFPYLTMCEFYCGLAQATTTAAAAAITAFFRAAKQWQSGLSHTPTKIEWYVIDDDDNCAKLLNLIRNRSTVSKGAEGATEDQQQHNDDREDADFATERAMFQQVCSNKC